MHNVMTGYNYLWLVHVCTNQFDLHVPMQMHALMYKMILLLDAPPLKFPWMHLCIASLYNNLKQSRVYICHHTWLNRTSEIYQRYQSTKIRIRKLSFWVSINGIFCSYFTSFCYFFDYKGHNIHGI